MCVDYMMQSVSLTDSSLKSSFFAVNERENDDLHALSWFLYSIFFFYFCTFSMLTHPVTFRVAVGLLKHFFKTFSITQSDKLTKLLMTRSYETISVGSWLPQSSLSLHC